MRVRHRRRPPPPQQYYVQQLLAMRAAEQSTLHVDYVHVLDWDEPLAASLAEEIARFEPWLKAGLQEAGHQQPSREAKADGEADGDGEGERP